MSVIDPDAAPQRSFYSNTDNPGREFVDIAECGQISLAIKPSLSPASTNLHTAGALSDFLIQTKGTLMTQIHVEGDRAARSEQLGPIVVAPHRFIGLDSEKALASEFGVELIESTGVDEFRAAIPEASLVLVTPYARVEAADFAAMKNCKAVVRYGIGYDNIDVDAAREVGVPVSIVAGANSTEVASHAVSLGLALVRRIPAGQKAIAEQGWAGTIAYETPRFSDLDVAVVGMGRIGRQVAEWYAALGANVRGYDPFAEFTAVPSAPLDELLTQSDLISLHVPLSDGTRNLISAETLGRMRGGAVVVNVSRGGLIDEVALAAALTSGRIAGAGIDTFATEPLPADSPLRDAPNLIMTPHIAWRSNKALAALQDSVVLRCRQALTGETMSDLVTD